MRPANLRMTGTCPSFYATARTAEAFSVRTQSTALLCAQPRPFVSPFLPTYAVALRCRRRCPSRSGISCYFPDIQTALIDVLSHCSIQLTIFRPDWLEPLPRRIGYPGRLPGRLLSARVGTLGHPAAVPLSAARATTQHEWRHSLVNFYCDRVAAAFSARVDVYPIRQLRRTGHAPNFGHLLPHFSRPIRLLSRMSPGAPFVGCAPRKVLLSFAWSTKHRSETPTFRPACCTRRQ